MELMILHVIFLFLKRNCYAYWAMLFTITYNKTIYVLMHACVLWPWIQKKDLTSRAFEFVFYMYFVVIACFGFGFSVRAAGIDLELSMKQRMTLNSWPSCFCLLNEYWDYESIHSLLGVISFIVAICLFYWNWWHKVEPPTPSKSQRFMKQDITLFTGGLSLGRRPPFCPLFFLLREADL